MTLIIDEHGNRFTTMHLYFNSVIPYDNDMSLTDYNNMCYRLIFNENYELNKMNSKTKERYHKDSEFRNKCKTRSLNNYYCVKK